MKKRGAKRAKAKHPKKRKATSARRTPARVGSWRTALTEADAAQRHVAQAAAAIERLARELLALRESAAQAARLELSRALQDGPDGGPLTLLAKLAASEDPADAPIARVARLIIERLNAVLGSPISAPQGS